MQSNSPKSAAGITLVELIFALAVTAVLMSVAISGIASVVHKSRGSLAGIDLVDSLTRARSLAVIRESDIVICPSSDGSSCLKSDHWESGWIAFGDLREDGERRGDEPVLIRQEPLGAKVHLVSSQGRTRLRFQPTGSNAGSNVTFTLCDGRGAKFATAWILSNNGSLRSAPATTAAADVACSAS